MDYMEFFEDFDQVPKGDYYKLDMNRMSNLNPIDIDQKSIHLLKGMISDQFSLEVLKTSFTGGEDNLGRIDVVKIRPLYPKTKWIPNGIIDNPKGHVVRAGLYDPEQTRMDMSSVRLIQVVMCEDEWYQVYLVGVAHQIDYYECDQIGGLKSFFHDLSE